MSEQTQQEQKAPVVEIKSAPKRRTTSKAAAAKEQAEKKAARPTLSDTAKKRLEELTAEINRIEALKEEREAVMRKERDRGVAITDMAGEGKPSGYSLARARQILSK